MTLCVGVLLQCLTFNCYRWFQCHAFSSCACMVLLFHVTSVFVSAKLRTADTGCTSEAYWEPRITDISLTAR